MTLLRPALIFLFALVANPANAQPWLVEDFSATFEARVGIARGETHLEFRSLGDDVYEVESHTRLKGIVSWFKRGEIVEKSQFRFRDGEIQTLWFERRDDVNKEDRNVSVRYDWTTREGEVTYQGESNRVDLPSDASNTLVMQIALMQDLRADTRRERYYVLGHKGLLQFDVSYMGDTEVESLDGVLPAIRYAHERPGSQTRTTFWAPQDYGYLPARCEIIKEGKRRGTLRLVDLQTG